MKNDTYGLENRYKNWKDEAVTEGLGIDGLTKNNSNWVIDFILDMEQGQNTARGTKKGGRSYIRLNHIRNSLTPIVKRLEERGIVNIKDTSKEAIEILEKKLTKLFSDFDRGEIKTQNGKNYKSAGDYAKVFKSAWHHWMKVNRKKGIVLQDICEDISTSAEKPLFVWLKKEELDKILPYFSDDEQTALIFMFDSGIRTPTECLSLTAGDIFEKTNEVWANVKQEISKTFGRQFNLLYCGEAVLKHIKTKKLKPNDKLFDFSPAYLNRKLKKVAEQVFGDKKPHPQCDYYKNLSLYDLRHSSAIHYRLLAKENPSEISLDAIRHRFGWSDFEMLNYYSQFLGMDGKIEKVGTLLKQDKLKMEVELEKLKDDFERMKEFFVSSAVGRDTDKKVREQLKKQINNFFSQKNVSLEA